jgi:hypothetical protein
MMMKALSPLGTAHARIADSNPWAHAKLPNG